MTSYKEAFPYTASQVLTSKLTKCELFPENVLPAADIVSYMRSASLLCASPSVLLGQQLWCLLGKVRVAQGNLPMAELCEHESFILNELDAGTYHLKGSIELASGRSQTALECFLLGLQMDPRNVGCLLGSARSYLELGTPNSAYLALFAATEAIDIEPNNVEALTLCADLSRKLSLDKQAGEFYNRAIELEEIRPIFPISSVIELLLVSNS